MPDSLNKIVDTIFIKQNENYELLNNVNAFYETSWNKLIIIGTVSFAIVGIIVPLILQWYQKRILQLSEDKMTNFIQSTLNKEIEKTNHLVERNIKEKNKEFEKRIEIMKYQSSAQIFHLQAMLSLKDQKYIAALSDLMNSAQNYFKAQDDNNLSTIIKGIDTLLSSLTKENILDEKLRGNDLGALLKTLEATKNPLLKDSVKSLIYKLSKKIS